MRIFKEMNVKAKDVCPVCKTKDKKEVVLIAKVGTQEGYNVQAIQVHLDCLDLLYDENLSIIYQKLNENKT